MNTRFLKSELFALALLLPLGTELYIAIESQKNSKYSI